jgi:hypothetical protein
MNAESNDEAIKLQAAMSVVSDSILHGWTDIAAVKRILPIHYEVKESKAANAIHCKSSIGIRMQPYLNSSTGNMITDAEDEEHWGYIMQAFRKHFGNRLKEVFHNTCFCHVDFTIFLTERK